jgi:hypothetical protein
MPEGLAGSLGPRAGSTKGQTTLLPGRHREGLAAAEADEPADAIDPPLAAEALGIFDGRAERARARIRRAGA